MVWLLHLGSSKAAAVAISLEHIHEQNGAKQFGLSLTTESRVPATGSNLVDYPIVRCW